MTRESAMGAKKPDAPGRELALKLEPGAWEQFEKAVGKVVKAPPQHRSAHPSKGRDALATSRKDKK